VSEPANLLKCVALGMALACDGGGGPKAEVITSMRSTALAPLGERDLDAYAIGTRAQIELIRRAIQSGRPADAGRSDSAAARAAGVPVDRYREIQSKVELLLKAQPALIGRAAGLDSLRTELIVLRVRAEGVP